MKEMNEYTEYQLEYERVELEELLSEEADDTHLRELIFD